MKRFLLLVSMGIFVMCLSAQTRIYHENFDAPSYADSVISTPSSAWGLSSSLSVSPSQCDTTTVTQGDTAILITTSFSTLGKNYVALEFDHICKVEYADPAEIFVSVDDGKNWIQLTGVHYLGESNFGLMGNLFSVAAYDTLWDGVNPWSIPQNSWWVHEKFDISVVAKNQANVKLMFRLRDGNNNGASNHYGWLIDNIKVEVEVDELIPPKINMRTPIHEDTVYFRGPYEFMADVTDHSGIDTVMFIYSRNGGLDDTLGMLNVSGDAYYSFIDTVPAFKIGDKVCYRIVAVDKSMMRNKTSFPNSSCLLFQVQQSPIPPNCSKVITQYPFIETFDSNFIAGSGNASNPGTFDPDWTYSPTGIGYVWMVKSSNTPSVGTGPLTDHSSGNGNYLYTEASMGANGGVAELIMPCIDINSLRAPYLYFYYHMSGSEIGELHVDVHHGGKWQLDVVSPVVGDQGDGWRKMEVNLSVYKRITQIRFRALKGNGFLGDIAIDDVLIKDLYRYDAGVLSVDTPTSPTITGIHDINVSLKNFGSDLLEKVDIHWQIDQEAVNLYQWKGYLPSSDTLSNLVLGQYDFSKQVSTLKVWTSKPNDSTDLDQSNDTLTKSIIACKAPLRGSYTIGGTDPDFATFEAALFVLENCGVDSATEINIAQGEYNVQIEIHNIPGTSASNTVTFKPLLGDTVVLKYNATISTENYIVRFDEASYIHFKGVSIESLNKDFGNIFVLRNNASNITIEECKLTMPVVDATSGEATGLVIKATAQGDNKFLNNEVFNGRYGVSLYGEFKGTLQYRNLILGNEFRGYMTHGVYARNQYDLSIQMNALYNAGSESSCAGIHLVGCEGYSLTANRIYTIASGSGYGIRIQTSTPSPSDRALVANNMVVCAKILGSIYGMYLSNSSYLDIYHNTIVIDSAVSENSRILYMLSGSDISIVNNIFCNKAGGLTYFLNSSVTLGQMDYNNLYSTGKNLAFKGDYKKDLAALQNTTPYDQNSISILPDFTSAYDLHIQNRQFNNHGYGLAEVLSDIDGDKRDSISPAIGADEKLSLRIDAGVAEVIISSKLQYQGDKQTIRVVLRNYGLDTLPAFTYSYSINGVAGPILTYPAGMLPAVDDTVSFPEITVGSGHRNLCAYVKQLQDSNVFNDEKCKYYYAVSLADVGVVEQLAPDSGSCYTASEPFIVSIKNYGSRDLKLDTIPITIHTEVNGPIQINVPDKIINSGVLKSGEEMQVVVKNSIDVSSTGVYEFTSWTSLAKDGDSSNDTMLDKSIDVFAIIKDLPYKQDFEGFETSVNYQDPGTMREGWVADDPQGYYPWYVGSGRSYNYATGPVVDHTTSRTGGKYVYAMAGYGNMYSFLVSPCFDLSSYPNPILTFWYHMFGEDVKSLRVDVLSEGKWHTSVGYLIGSQQQSETDAWEQARVDLSDFTGIVRIRFRSIKGERNKADIAIDDVLLYNRYSEDLAISTSFVEPKINITAIGEELPVKIKIENLGLDTVTQFTLGYMTDISAPVMAKWQGKIPPLGSTIYEFDAKLTAPRGKVGLCAFVHLKGDHNRKNDTVCMQLAGASVMPLPFHEDFEKEGNMMAGGGFNQWERGLPTKRVFTSGHNSSSAWVTGLRATYADRSEDYLYTPYFDFSSMPNCTLSFYHRIDAQRNKDGGYIQYSTDEGKNWLNLGYEDDPLSTSWYNANINGTYAWSDLKTDWMYSSYDLSSFNTYTTPVQFRFVFMSNESFSDYDGWIIDDLTIAPSTTAIDAGVEAILSPEAHTLPGTSVNVKVKVKNYGSQSLSSIPVYYQVNQQAPVSTVWTGNLAQDEIAEVDFSVPYNALASYRLSVWTELPNDSYSFNDTVSVYINKDVAIKDIVLPFDNETEGDSVYVALSLQNNGSDTVFQLRLEYDVNSSTPVQEMWSGVLPPEQSRIYHFKKTFQMNSGSVELCARLSLVGDTRIANNQKCKTINGDVSAQSVWNTNAVLLNQNSPNPFKEYSQFSFELPYSGEVDIRVLDLYGRVLSVDRVKASRGVNHYTLNRQKLEAGVYFYEIQFEEHSLRKKMIVVD